jgi:nucleoside-diphosphate-sugar epimerase
MNFNIIDEDLEIIINQKICWDELRDLTILVTGANGFLPAYMVETMLKLNKKGYNIRILALIRNKNNAEKRFLRYLDNPNLKFIYQDVCDPIGILEPVNIIIHAASQASPKFYSIDPVGTLKSNVIGNYNLLDFARKQDDFRNFLYFSSGEVYGDVKEYQIPTKENEYGYIDPTSLRSCYAESKRMGENICISFFYQFQIPVKIVRPFHTYGPGMNLNDGRVFADFVSNVVQNQDIVIKSDGSAIRAFCYLADAICGFFYVLLNGSLGESYNVGSDIGTSIKELAEILVGLFPEKDLKIVLNPSLEDHSSYVKSTISINCPDISKIRSIGWNPIFSIEKGFLRTINYYSK